ncbi:hypothetical protein ABPG77_003468 [Micractinium sp. CCAP 211/92]
MKQQRGSGRQPKPPAGKGGGKPRGKITKSNKPKSVKNQIRDMERLLAKPDLDPKMRARLEGKLEELKAAQAQHQRQELERKYAVRYHKVRFFERVKLERRIKKLQAQVSAAQGGSAGAAVADAASTGNTTNGSGAGGAGDLAQLEAALAAAKEDLEYVLHFPKAEKYVSILRQADTAEAQEALDAERSRLRALVKRQLAEAALLAEADEGAALANGAPAAVAAPGAAAGRPAAAAQLVAGEGGEGELEEEDDFFLGSDEEAEGPAAAQQAQQAQQQQAGRPSAPREARTAGRPVAGAKRKARHSAEPQHAGSSSDEDGAGADSSEDEQAAGASSDDWQAGGSSEGEEGDEELRQQVGLPAAAHKQRGGQQQGTQPGSAGRQRQQQRDRGSKPRQQQGRNPASGGKQRKGEQQQRAGSSRPPPQQKQQHPKAKPERSKAQEQPAGAPLRTRAEGGRKRRKKK